MWEKSVEALADELTRAEELGLLGVVFHPGAHMGEGEEAGIARIVEGIDAAHRRTAGFKTLTLVEGTAGQGTALGYKFEHLQAMLQGVEQPERLAFCLDTCHLFAAGYDLRTEQTYADTMGQFDDFCGIGAAEVLPLQRREEAARLARRPARPYRHRAIGAGGVRVYPERPAAGGSAEDPRDGEERGHARGRGEPAGAAQPDPLARNPLIIPDLAGPRRPPGRFFARAQPPSSCSASCWTPVTGRLHA